MLSFLKLCRLSRDLKLIFSNKSDLMKININVNYPNLNAQNGLFQIKLYSTEVNKEEVIPLEEISNVVSTYKNFNSEGLNPLIEVINKHKAHRKGLPEYIKLTDVRDILECKTPSSRSSYLTYLFKKEQIKLKSKEKKLKEKIARERRYMEMLENDKKNNHIQYGLGRNTLILRTLRRSVMRYYEKRLANAALFGQKIVIDLGYDKLMSKKEKKACVSQIRLLYSCNRLSHDPYDLYICNATSENRCVEYLRYEMPNVDESFATLTGQSYLDLFPKDNLVYLSPHASEVLTTYDPKAVYIIGIFCLCFSFIKQNISETLYRAYIFVYMHYIYIIQIYILMQYYIFVHECKCLYI